MDGPIDTYTHSHKTHTHTRSLGKMTSLTTHSGIRIAFKCQVCKTSWAIADKNDDRFIHATFTLWWSHSRHVTEKEEWPPICAERPLSTTSQHSLTFTWASVGQVSWHIKRGGSANLFDTGVPLPPPPELLSLLLKKSRKLHISQQKNDHCTYMCNIFIQDILATMPWREKLAAVAPWSCSFLFAAYSSCCYSFFFPKPRPMVKRWILRPRSLARSTSEILKV